MQVFKPNKAHLITVGTYAALVFAGGIMGYLKASSLMSLIFGSLSSGLLFISLWGMLLNNKWGKFSALAISCGLTLFFGYRFIGSYAFFPAGIMTLLSIITAIILTIPNPLNDHSSSNN